MFVSVHACRPENPRCVGLLLGVEQAVMPLFDLSAFALSILVFSGRRDLKAYVVSQTDRASTFTIGFITSVKLGFLKWQFGLQVRLLLCTERDRAHTRRDVSSLPHHP